MSLYEQRLADDKSALRRRVHKLGQDVNAAVRSSVAALLAGERARSYELILADLPINRESRALDRACHAFVARHLPSAGHLRFVSSVMRMNLELERVGDYAVSVSRHAVQLDAAPEGWVAEQMATLAESACAMLEEAMTAFSTGDAELARDTKPLAKRMQSDLDAVYGRLASESTLSVKEGASVLSVFNKLGRVCAQAKNVCEVTLFEQLGETKPPKRYRILFVDARAALIAPLAELLARKAFPESGTYESAGYRPASELAPELVSLADELGLDAAEVAPKKLPSSLQAYHVVVWLNGDSTHQLKEVPYETVLLHWDLPKLSEAGDAGVEARLRDIGNALSANIRELMVTMRGEDAG